MLNNTKKLSRRELFGVATLFCVAGWGTFQYWEKQEMWRVTRIWARLAPLPNSTARFAIVEGGTIFTRSFRCAFYAPLEDIRQWLKDSPGTQDAMNESAIELPRSFSIAPGDGAQHAELSVENKGDGTGLVEIYVYWS